MEEGATSSEDWARLAAARPLCRIARGYIPPRVNLQRDRDGRACRLATEEDVPGDAPVDADDSLVRTGPDPNGHKPGQGHATDSDREDHDREAHTEGR